MPFAALILALSRVLKIVIFCCDASYSALEKYIAPGTPPFNCAPAHWKTEQRMTCIGNRQNQRESYESAPNFVGWNARACPFDYLKNAARYLAVNLLPLTLPTCYPREVLNLIVAGGALALSEFLAGEVKDKK
jgi:hypothetical protein